MPISSEIPVVNFNNAAKLLTASVAADIPVLLLGDPGIGKNALINIVGKELNLPVRALLGSTVDPTDVGGIPFREGNAIVRLPLQVIRDACDFPCLLFLDEISCAPPSVQAALLRLILERVAGDSKLHPGTRVLAAANPPEQAPSGFDLSSPLIGRMMIVHLRPDADEVLDFFRHLGDEGTTLRSVAEEFTVAADVSRELLQIDIPKDAVTGSSPWGAPRSWERAIRARASGLDQNIPDSSDVALALVTGSVGKQVGHAFIAIMRLRGKLPTIEEIVADPENAMMPNELKEQIASLGQIVHVAKVDYWAAWLYASRLPRKEFQAAATRLLRTKVAPNVTGPRAKAGIKARTNLIASLPTLTAGR